MNTVRTSTKIQEKYKKVTDSHRAEEDSNGTKKHTGEVQQQTRSRSKDSGTQGQSNGTQPVKAAKKKIAKKTYQTISHRPTQMNIYIIGVPKGEVREREELIDINNG